MILMEQLFFAVKIYYFKKKVTKKNIKLEILIRKCIFLCVYTQFSQIFSFFLSYEFKLSRKVNFNFRIKVGVLR
jgi:hypothetical protein